MKAIKVIIFSAILAVCSLTISAQELTYMGTLSVIKGDNVFTYENVEYKIKLNTDKKTGDFTTVGMKFGDRMPGNLTIFFGDVPYTEDCGEYSFEAELLNPTVDGKPGTAKIKNFSATTIANDLSVVFDAGRTMAQYDGSKTKK